MAKRSIPGIERGITRVLTAVALGAALCLAGACSNTSEASAKPAAADPAGDPTLAKAPHVCPMRCKVEGESEPYEQVGPGECPVCGMHLEPKK